MPKITNNQIIKSILFFKLNNNSTKVYTKLELQKDLE